MPRWPKTVPKTANTRVWEVVLAVHRIEPWQIDLSKVDPSYGVLDAWIGLLADAERRLRRMRLQLEALKVEPRSCVMCGRPVFGRSDRRFCSGACRQRAHRTGTLH